VVGRESEGVTRAQVEAFIEQARTDARNGRLNLPKGRKTALRFSEAADNYIERLRDSAGSNINRKERHLALHLRPFFSSYRLDKISEFAVQSYRKARRDARAADGTINRELATLSHLLRSAVRWGWIKRDDVPQIDRAREDQGRIIALSDNQCRALMSAAIADQDTYLWLFVAIGLGTGMRHSEICAIRWDHVDFDRRRIFVPIAKAGSRDQPIPADLAAKLAEERAQRAESAVWVFPGREGETTKGHRVCFAKGFRRAVIAAGLDDKIVTPHVMRHTAVTRLVRAGADIPNILKISGHKTVSMVLRYAHVDAAHIDAAASALEMSSGNAIHPEFTAPVKAAAATAS
jgi:integrase